MKYVSHLYEALSRLSAVRKPIRIAALAVMVTSLAACNMDLYDNLSQKQANEIVSVLFRQGIPAERVIGKDGKFAVQVDKSRFAEAIAVLNDNGLPKQDFATLGEVFKNDGIVASPVQERAQMIFALSQELSRTISDIDGILSARVHLVLPENDPLRQQLIPSSASVYIRHVKSAPINTLTPQIKSLVANGVAGLSYEKVTVVPVAANVPEPDTTLRANQDLESFLGIWMHRDSVNRAAWIFFSLLTLVFAAGAGAVLIGLNQRKRTYLLPSESRVKT